MCTDSRALTVQEILNSMQRCAKLYPPPQKNPTKIGRWVSQGIEGNLIRSLAKKH